MDKSNLALFTFLVLGTFIVIIMATVFSDFTESVNFIMDYAALAIALFKSIETKNN